MDAPLGNSVLGRERFAQAQLIRSIETNLAEVEDTLNSLKKPEGADGRLGYDKNGRKFTPRSQLMGLMSEGHTCTAVCKGLLQLHCVASEVFLQLCELPTTPEHERTRQIFKERLEKLAATVENQARPCIDFMVSTYNTRKKDLDKLADLQRNAEGSFHSINQSVKLLNGANPLLLSSTPADAVTRIVLLPTKIPKEVEICVYELVEKFDETREGLQEVQYRLNDLILVPAVFVARCLSQIQAMRNNHPQKDILKAAIILKHNTQRPFERCVDLITPNDTRWRSFQIQNFFDHNHFVEGASTPTSERSNNDASNHLVNFKAQIDETDGHIAITCGVINTERKAKEFILGLEHQLKTRARNGNPKKLRITLHQLNSFKTGEEKFIRAENYFANYVEAYFKKQMENQAYCEAMHLENADQPIVSHINLAMNAAASPSLPVSIRYIEDSESHAQNMEGLAAQCIWLLRDSSSFKGFDTPEAKKIIEELSKTRLHLIAQKKACFEAGSKHTNEVFQAQKMLNLFLFEAAKLLVNLDKTFILPTNGSFVMREGDDAFEDFAFSDIQKENASKNSAADIILIKSRLKVLVRILGAQVLGEERYLAFRRNFAQHDLGLPTLERMEELEFHLLNDITSGCISEMNCKSGLDRTGLARAIWDAMRQMHQKFNREHLQANQGDRTLASSQALESMIHLITKQSQHMAEVDQIIAEIIAENNLICVTDIKSIDSQKLSITLRDSLNAKLKAKYKDPVKCKELLDAFNYQNLIGANIFKVAQIVTLESTGVPGMKWGKDYGISDVGANPFPPKRMPRYIASEGCDKLIQLVTEKNILTDAGVVFLICWGNLRGE